MNTKYYRRNGNYVFTVTTGHYAISVISATPGHLTTLKRMLLAGLGEMLPKIAALFAENEFMAGTVNIPIWGKQWYFIEVSQIQHIA